VPQCSSRECACPTAIPTYAQRNTVLHLTIALCCPEFLSEHQYARGAHAHGHARGPSGGPVEIRDVDRRPSHSARRGGNREQRRRSRSLPDPVFGTSARSLRPENRRDALTYGGAICSGGNKIRVAGDATPHIRITVVQATLISIPETLPSLPPHKRLIPRPVPRTLHNQSPRRNIVFDRSSDGPWTWQRGSCCLDTHGQSTSSHSRG